MCVCVCACVRACKKDNLRSHIPRVSITYNLPPETLLNKLGITCLGLTSSFHPWDCNWRPPCWDFYVNCRDWAHGLTLPSEAGTLETEPFLVPPKNVSDWDAIAILLIPEQIRAQMSTKNEWIWNHDNFIYWVINQQWIRGNCWCIKNMSEMSNNYAKLNSQAKNNNTTIISFMWVSERDRNFRVNKQ